MLKTTQLVLNSYANLFLKTLILTKIKGDPKKSTFFESLCIWAYIIVLASLNALMVCVQYVVGLGWP